MNGAEIHNSMNRESIIENFIAVLLPINVNSTIKQIPKLVKLCLLIKNLNFQYGELASLFTITAAPSSNIDLFHLFHNISDIQPKLHNVIFQTECMTMYLIMHECKIYNINTTIIFICNPNKCLENLFH